MEAINYGEFSSQLHSRVRSERIPTEAIIEVTRRCPLECAHCYNNLPMADQSAKRSELTYEEHCRILDELAEIGTLWLLFTGGEIFARRDFLDIYTYAKRKGFLVTLYTNGTLLTEKIADYLQEWRPFSIEITLYGRTKETYERLTGIPGSYEKCLRGIQLLKERGLPLKLKTVAVTVNKHEVFEMGRFAEEELGVEFKYDSLMSPRIDCSDSPLAVRLSAEEVVEFDLADAERQGAWHQLAADLQNPVVWGDDVYHCGGGLTSFAVDPEGKMSICVLSHRDVYDLRRGSVVEGWDGFLSKVRSRKMTRPSKCATCQIRASCGMCPANGELENGDPEAPVDFLCEVTHLRTHALGLQVPAHGDCEFCEQGSRYPDLLETAARLRARRGGKLPSGVTQNRYLPVLARPRDGVSTGCSSCSASGH
jgi:radical SAM protein with 4Fe4S-binding SPASM domain